jgi:uncharacterized repeat protein (TIGR03806 family)
MGDVLGRAAAPLLLACGIAGACGSSPARDPAPAPVAAARAEAPARAGGFAFPLEPASPTALRAEPAFPSLRFERPVFLGHAPGDPDHVYVVEQVGRILRVENRPGAEKAEVFLDISDRVRMQHDEEGLLGLAFSPGYADDRTLYLYYSASGPRRTQLSRFVATTPGRADAASEAELLRIEQPYGNHNGGMIAFGPDGKLYVGVGDGGAADDPHGNGQDLGTLLGAILRLEVGPDIATYRVPQDNPFVEHAGARPEIWAFGLRNPWRFSFDRQTGALWCGDVGQNELEEVDLVQRGGNYGWNAFEGTRVFRRGKRTASEIAAPVPPVVEYGRDEGESITGGYVVRGTRLADFRGMYLYGDYVSGHVWALDADDGRVRSHARVAHVPALSSFGEDAQGEIYALSFDGRIRRFEAEDDAVAARSFPTRLSQTGLFIDTAALTPAPALQPYDVAVELWSDGARKTRWLALPGGASIEYSRDDAWSFPIGTIAVKHFELPVDDAHPEATRRLETRVMIHERRGWAGYTYRWDDAQTDATLVTATTTGDIEVVRGGRRSMQRWVFPAGSDCLRCHTPTYGELLGVRTRQLAGAGGLLERLAAQGRLDPAPDLAHAPSHPGLDDENAGVDARARAYLDVNCAPCHHPGGPAPGAIDLRAQTPLARTALVDARAETPVEPGGVRVRPGQAARSELWLRMQHRGDRHAMPPLASVRVDPVGPEIVRRFIDGLASR